MCEPASFVVTKKQVFWSENGDSHELIIEENNLKEMDIRKKPTFVRVEIVPPNRDYRLPFKKWAYKLDQDIKPDWYDEKDVESRCRAVLKKWLKSNVILPNQKVKSINKYIVAVYGSIHNVWGSAVIHNVWGSAVIHDVWGSAVINNVWGSAVINNVGDSAVINNVWGSAVIHNVGGSAVIHDVRDSAVINNVRGSAVIISHSALKPDILKSSKAVLINRSVDDIICYVGKNEE